MFFQSLDLTTAQRPALLSEETLLFVQDAVGLYDGKYKIPNLQNGHAYLTSHRICYVDNLEPRKSSIAIELKNIEKYEFYVCNRQSGASVTSQSSLLQAGFLKSSPKITLYPKAPKGSAFHSLNSPHTPNKSTPSDSPTSAGHRSPLPSNDITTPSVKSWLSNVTWICTICTFSNPIPSNFDVATAKPHTPLPPCLACGIKPSLAHVLKAAISNASVRRASPALHPVPTQPLLESHGQYNNDSTNDYENNSQIDDVYSPPKSGFECPRCTFRNHPQLLSCELCGAPLLSAETPTADGRSESPGPILEAPSSPLGNSPECVKLSFRAGGDKIFHERLKGAMVQRKWLLNNAPPVPKPSQERAQALTERTKVVGIAGLERRGQEQRNNNAVAIGSAFEDLEALMASAKEIVVLAESFAKTSADDSASANTLRLESASPLGMITTKEMLGSRSGSGSLYLSELSRNLAEYLTDDARGILKKEGGIMSLVDLWAIFSRAKGGVDLVSPVDFEKAARLWEKLSLPVRLRQFKTGLLVVQRHDWTDDKTIAQILAWFDELRQIPPSVDVNWDWTTFGRGVTAQETARRFGWSVGVASEELEMAEDKGVLCREEGVEGLRFWENFFMDEEHLIDEPPLNGIESQEAVVLRNLEEMFGSW